jgi:hypothetical protein
MITEQTEKSAKLNEALDKILSKCKNGKCKAATCEKCTSNQKAKKTCFDKELVEQVDKKLVLEDGRQLLL